MKVFTKNAELSARNGSRSRADRPRPDDGSPGTRGIFRLVKKCREECDRAVVSVFVNPTHVLRTTRNDLKEYPRTEEADLALLEKTGVDYVLMPSVERRLSAEGHPCVRSGYDGQNDGGSPPPGSFQRSGPGRQPAVRHRPARTGPTSERRISEQDRRDPRNGPSLRLPGTDHRHARSFAVRTDWPSARATRCSPPPTARPDRRSTAR